MLSLMAEWLQKMHRRQLWLEHGLLACETAMFVSVKLCPLVLFCLLTLCRC